MEINEILKYMRQIKHMSGKSVAEKIGCAPNTLANWEKGKVSPPVDAAFKLCEVYDITPNQLFGYEPIPDIEVYLENNVKILLEIQKLENAKAEAEKRIREYQKRLSQEP